MTCDRLEARKVIDARHCFAHSRNPSKLPKVELPGLPEAALRGIAGDYIRLIGPRTEAHPAALLIQFFSFFGNVVGRNAFAYAGGTEHHGNLFVVVVGPSSTARKGTSLAHVKSIFKRVCPQWFEKNIVAGLSSGEGLIYHLRDKPTDIGGTDDEGKLAKPDRRCLVIETEFARTLAVAQREGNTLSAVMRNCWDCEDIQIMTKADPVKATDTYVSIVGHITPGELKATLKGVDRANGFGNRFLWVSVDRTHEIPRQEPIDSSEFCELDDRLSRCIERGLRTKRRLPYTDDANECWDGVYHDLTEGSEDAVGELTSRGETQVMRLALIYALLDERDEIDVVHLESALALWGYCYESVSMLFGEVFSTPLATTVFEHLRQHVAGLTRAELSAKLSNNFPSAKIQAALSELERDGFAEKEVRKHSGPGRPETVWRLASTEVLAYAN